MKSRAPFGMLGTCSFISAWNFARDVLGGARFDEQGYKLPPPRGPSKMF